MDFEVHIYDNVYYYNKKICNIDLVYNKKLVSFETYIDQFEFQKLILEITNDICDHFVLTLFNPIELSYNSYYNYLARTMQIVRYIRTNPGFDMKSIITDLQLSSCSIFIYYPVIYNLCNMSDKNIENDFNIYISNKLIAFCISNMEKFKTIPDAAYIFSIEQTNSNFSYNNYDFL